MYIWANGLTKRSNYSVAWMTWTWKKEIALDERPPNSYFYRQKREIGRRMKRPLTGPNLNIPGVSVDSPLLRPFAGLKPTGHDPNRRCTGMRWIDEQIEKREMRDTGVPATRCSFLSSPMPIHRKANVEKFTASMCDDWLLSIHRPNL